MKDNPLQTFLVGNLAFGVLGLLLVHRLVRKNYRSFRIWVVRPDGLRSRNLSMHELCLVWLYIVLVDVALVVAVDLFAWMMGFLYLLQGSALSLLLRSLLTGPLALGSALRTRYPGFRLQASGRRVGTLRQSNSLPDVQ